MKTYIITKQLIDKRPKDRELKKHNVPFRGPLILGKGESVHFKDPDGNHLEIRCPVDLNVHS